MSLVITGQPTVEPVTLAEMRAHLRLSDSPNYALGVTTQTVTLPAIGVYTLTVAGAGTVTAAAGTAVGTGWGAASAASPKTLNITTAGTVTLTIAGVITSISLMLDNADDDLISSLITACRQDTETHTRRAFITQSWQLVLDAFPSVIAVPLPPLQSVESIKYINSDGDEITLDSSLYRVDIVSEPGRITPAYGESWPSTQGITGAVTIDFTAGYGDTGADVPSGVKNAIKLDVERLYERDVRMMDSLEKAKDALLGPYRVITF